MDARGFIESIRSSPAYNGQIAHVESIPGCSAAFKDVSPPLPPGVSEALARSGVTRLYSHQAESLQALRKREHVVVVTPTASGKTLCYNAAVLEALENDESIRALYIYPTKALAQDQLQKIKAFGLPFVRAATYDGDTPRGERGFVKSSANIVLTNPDMLHLGILPYHSTWAALFRNLRFVVVDEVHSYRGIFGAHVANVLRRLRRIAAYYGSFPTFVCCSATIRDPGELVNSITGIAPRVISESGAPSGSRVFAFWNPPFLAAQDGRRSANSEAVDLFVSLVKAGVRTLVFAKARKTAELILRYARSRLKDDRSDTAERIMSYRAGYRPEERRQIERRLFSGELLGVASTSALEVGVDIGGLDAVIIAGYPGTVASTWQQAGRSGRASEESLAVLVARDDPVDQYLMRNPDFFFRSEPELAVVDPENPYVLADQLLCAAYELPLENSEIEEMFGQRAWEVLGLLEEYDWLSYRRRWFWNGTDFPAKKVSIRSTSSETYNIVSVDGSGAVLGTVDAPAAFETVHPGAVYLHAGESYIVTQMDQTQRTAFVSRTEVNYYTTPGTRTRVSVAEEISRKPLGSAAACFGDVEVESKVTHFWRKRLFTEKAIDKVPLDLPEIRLATEALWVAIPSEIAQRASARGIDLAGAIHAIEHACVGVLPLFVLCDRNDLGGVSHPQHPDTGHCASIFVYDGHEGGVGLSRSAYDRLDDLIDVTLQTIEDCSCENGCPGCVYSPKCGNNNEPLDKAGAVFLLREILKTQTPGG